VLSADINAGINDTGITRRPFDLTQASSPKWDCIKRWRMITSIGPSWLAQP
jgi:hypothetical protein